MDSLTHDAYLEQRELAWRVVQQEWCLMEQAPLLLYATPAHAVRDMHHVSNYPSTLEESVGFG